MKNSTHENKKSMVIALSAVGVIIAAVIGIGIYSLVSDSGEKVAKKQNTDKAFNTSAYSQSAMEENEYQYSDTVIEANSQIFAMDASKITVRKSGTNDEKTIATGNLAPGMVTNSQTLYYFDADTSAIMSVDVKSGKAKEVVKPAENVTPDEKSTSANYEFARFDGMYGDSLYYQMQEGEEYMPNYCVDVKTGKVTKLSLADYGTYKFQIADGRLYYDIFRTMNSPTVLYSSLPDGSDKKTIVEGITNFEVIGDKVYYFKAEDITKSTNKIMVYHIKTGKSEVIKENLPYVSGGFTSYAMIYDMSMGNTVHTVVDYYDGAGEALGGNGVKLCGEVAIVHAGVPEDITTDEAMEAAKNPEWYLVGNGVCSEIIKLPENTTPVNFKDGYFYYYTYTADGKNVINRTKINF